METDIQFVSTIGSCTEFMSPDGDKCEVSVVISPLKVNQEENSIKVISGCSMWKACRNKDCQFSLVSRSNGKVVEVKQ